MGVSESESGKGNRKKVRLFILDMLLLSSLYETSKDSRAIDHSF